MGRCRSDDCGTGRVRKVFGGEGGRGARELRPAGAHAGDRGRLATLGPGRCTVEVPFSERVGQQQGFFHGGVIGAVADTAGGYAALSLLPVGSEVVTREYKINFLRPAAGDRLLAEGVVLRAGRSVTVTRVDVFVDAGGRRSLCAALQQSIMRALAPSTRSML